MTAPDLPLPAEGGSYLRDPDTNALTLIVDAEPDHSDAIDPATAAPEAPPAKTRKQPVKEG